MKIAELRSGLSDLQRMLENFGAKKPSAEMHSLIEALAEFDEITVPELVRQIKAIHATKAAATKSQEKPKTINEEAVSEALIRLQAASPMAEEFDTVLADVLKDKRLKQSELKELAFRFGGTTPEKLTKAGVSAFLKERRLEIKRQGGLGSTIDRMLGRTGT